MMILTALQWARSLFTTGGNLNPLAIAIFAGTIFLGSQYISLKADNYRLKYQNSKLAKQTEIIKEAGVDKVEALNEARNEQKKSNDTSGTDDWYDWAERLQDDY